MPDYNVPIVEKDKLTLWKEFWEGKEPTQKSIDANKRAELGQSVFVKAKNKQEAKKIAEKNNPGCVAILSAISLEG